VVTTATIATKQCELLEKYGRLKWLQQHKVDGITITVMPLRKKQSTGKVVESGDNHGYSKPLTMSVILGKTINQWQRLRSNDRSTEAA